MVEALTAKNCAATELERSRERPDQPRHFWPSFAAGCAVALIVMELVLHPFSGKYENAAGMEQSWFTEGIATSHFSPAGLRLTGNPQIAGAPSVVVLGDSHVEAFQVYDQQTMGSVLECRLRTAGKQWNVLQYAWSGANGPDYVYAAPLIQDMFHPQRIFLVMDAGDFVSSTSVARLVQSRSGVVAAEPVGPGSVPGRPRSYSGKGSRIVKESGLFYASALRFTLDILPRLKSQPPDDQEGVLVPASTSQSTVELVVRGLKQAYGDKLVIVYAPAQPFFLATPPEPQEAYLLKACQAESVACLSLQEPMLQDLETRHGLARGFINTPPGLGHLNARGHELAANAMYEWLGSSR
jgi:hypothetical protein